MRSPCVVVLLVCLATLLLGQDSAEGPTDKRAQKTYALGLQSLRERAPRVALRYFRDADKQDQGHCLPCHEQMVKVGLAVKDWKAVEDGAAGLGAEVQEPMQQAVAHYYFGMALTHEGIDSHQDDLINRAHSEFSKAISLYPRLPDVLFEDGKALAQLHRDEEARAEFEKFIAMSPKEDFKRWRASQFVSKPELARANLVPEFTANTDRQRVSVRDLAGKVVLVHFWATACDTCSRDWPRLRALAKKFEDRPFVILNVSVDYNPSEWRSYLEKNDVPGLQCMEGFNGPIAQAFGVGVQVESTATNPIGGMWISSTGAKQDIPKTFTIDADGVFREEKMSDSLDGRLSALLASANDGKSAE